MCVVLYMLFDIPIIVALKRKLLIDNGVIRFFCN